MGTCEGPIDPRPLTPILLMVIDLEEVPGSYERAQFPHCHRSQMSPCH